MRPTDVPDQGLLCDLLWADPDKDVLGWGENDRGVSFTFGADVVAKFLHKHDMDLICRAHQVDTGRGLACARSVWGVNTFFSVLRSSKMVTSFSQRDSLSLCSQPRTTAASLTMLVPWWAWTRHSCARSRYVYLCKWVYLDWRFSLRFVWNLLQLWWKIKSDLGQSTSVVP